MATAGRGKGRPSLAETADIDRAIRDAALRVLLEQGEAATMQAIATAAGLSRKSLYARYPNKEELFLTAMRDLLRTVGRLDCAGDGDAEQRLQGYVEAALTLISRDEARIIQRLLTTEPAYTAALRADMLGATHRIFLEPLIALLEAAKAAGAFAIDDIEATARVIIRLIFTENMMAEEQSPGGLSADGRASYAAFLTRLITRGLLPRAG